MGRVNETGFTVIEVILFLAITGLLFAALMVGVGSGINQQRYLDSARSFRALVQDQYAATLNIDNRTTQYWGCQSNGVIDSNVTRSDRGTSDCVILGRIIQILPVGNDGIASVKTSSVTGRLKSGVSDVQSMTDLDALANYQPRIAHFDEQVTDMDWGSFLTTVTNANQRQASQGVVAILRSPATGLVRVFTSTSALTSDDLKDLISAVNGSTPLSTCIENNSPVLTPRLMITIDPRIASADGVTLDGGRTEACQ